MDDDTAAGTRFLATAHELADLARKGSLPWFRQPVATRFKTDASPVTEVDRAVESALRRLLEQLHPDHGVVGEEFEAEQVAAEWVWTLDPIDGTKSFISGIPMWGTLIALLHCGRPVLGVIDAPAMGERWSALRASSTWYRGRDTATPHRCSTSTCTRLAQARLCLPSPDGFGERAAEAVRCLGLQTLLNRYGGDCYSYGLLASGHLDLIIETGLDDHDFLPLVPVIESAGGVISDWQGRRLARDSAGDIVAAATVALHWEALARLRGDG